MIVNESLVVQALDQTITHPPRNFHPSPTADFNDVPTSPSSRNGIAGQNKGEIITNLMANGARNHNNVVFIFQNGTAIGAWAFQTSALQSPGLTGLLNVMNVTHAHPQPHSILSTFHIAFNSYTASFTGI
ncbi:14519_t:CDS:2 [Entrophospora sp. SA101]|nr:14519_t:CDS:2 [Entrophospora sp. SA101]